MTVGTLYASARWNRPLSRRVLTFAARRVGGNTRLALREAVSGH